MRRVPFILLCLTLFLTACLGGDSNEQNILGLNSGPTPVVSLDGGIQTAVTFLDAWAVQDYNTMYGLISPNARDAYPQEAFTEFYENLWENLRLQGLDWQRGDALLQGTTAVIRYDVQFQSSVLGEFEDENRLMRIIPTDEGMRLAWSRMDIFEGWAGDARLQVERFLASRGNIFDQNGRALADQNGIALPMYLTRNDIGNEAACIELLVPLLGREYNDIQATFARYNADTLFFIGEIDPETYQARGSEIDGTCRPEIGERRTRRYFATAAPHVVGYVGQIPAEQAAEYDQNGYPADALVGLQGIERTWERELRGNIGNRLSLFAVTDERLRTITEAEASPGQSIYLTLDRDLQQGITEVFANAYSFAQPTWGSTSPGAAAVIIDVNTGAIRAMVSYPTFDPSVFNPDSPYLDPGSLIRQYNTDRSSPLVNRAIQGRYPLGSVFKLVSTVAGADSGLVPLDT
ncbi:MAG: penicillin-binding transpeptidase domain-containing protein, partial [Anaerolineales bacterium]